MALTGRRFGVLLLAILLIVSSWVAVAVARSVLEVRSLQREGIPLLYLTPQGAKVAPGVLVAHGFAGSKQLYPGVHFTALFFGWLLVAGFRLSA